MTRKRRILSLIMAVTAASLPYASAFAESPLYRQTVTMSYEQARELSELSAGSRVANMPRYSLTVPNHQQHQGLTFTQSSHGDDANFQTITLEWIQSHFSSYAPNTPFDSYYEDNRDYDPSPLPEEMLSDPEHLEPIKDNIPNVEPSTTKFQPASNDDGGPALSQDMLLQLLLTGVMEGGGNSFHLDRLVTRGEFIKMTAAALGKAPEETPAGSFWAEGYVKTAISNGWLAGAIEGFDYGGTVSYQEARDILARALGAEALSDLKLSQGARVEVASQPLSRKQAAVIFSNLLSFLTGSENP